MKNKFTKIFGLSFFVSVGYMDPGNWATDIAAGSQFGYKLIWVIVVSNIIAILLQSLTVVGVKYSGYDLAETCKLTYGKKTKYVLWLLAQIAIIATDLAELLGSAIALKLLFNIPLMIGVLITILDVFLILFLENKGFKKLQAIVVALVLTITLSFILEIFIVGLDVKQLAFGLIPQIDNYNALILTIGIIGATIMPHNLYMQSGLIKRERANISIKEEVKDLIIALNLAMIVNCSIMILSAQVFNQNGYTEVASIETAYYLLAPLVGLKASALLFGFALLLSGQASTITGTLAGQIVMEGFLDKKVDIKVLRFVTRLCAMIPTLILLAIFGEGEVDNLLIGSQVILSLQLPFAIIPLIASLQNSHFMHGYKLNKFIMISALISAFVIIGLNLILVIQSIVYIFHNIVFATIIVGIIVWFMGYLGFKQQVNNI